MKGQSECLTADMLDRYVTGKLSVPEVALVEHHLEECSNCVNMLSSAAVRDPFFRGATLAGKCADELARSSAEIAALKAKAKELGTTISWRRTPGHSPAVTLDWADRQIIDYTPNPGDLPLLFDHDRYRIQRRLGHGGMGAVYLATDTRLDRPVAIKIPVLNGTDDAGTVQRFQVEAVALARLHLHHSNLCMIYDAAECDGIPYLTMRYIEGTSLRRRLDAYRGRSGVVLVEILARALSVVHTAGVIHRDIKPENVIIDSRGQPVIVDFGLARSTDGQGQVAGNVEGTLAYMAPEQQAGQGQSSGPACDIYSLGVVLFELLAGQNPFRGTFTEVLEQKRSERYTPLEALGLDAALVGLCGRALRNEPTARFANMIEFADGLAAYLRDEAADLPAALPASPRSGHAVSTVSHPMDPRIADEVLPLLREWGWEVGLARLEQRIQEIPDIQRRALLRLLAGWIKGERGDHAAGIEQFREAEQIPEMRAWARAGQAFIRYRTSQLDEAWKLLDLAEQDAASDAILQATIDHGRGAIRYRQARDDEALEYLYRAAERFGPDHFGFGRVVDTLGMIYVTKENFPAAFSLFQKALVAKEKHQDLLGLALTHGQLGRLLLDWGEPDRAEKEFRADLELCLRTNDSRGEAQMFNQLGQVFLARGQASRALEYLNESVTRCQALGFADSEGYARKDRARALVALGRATEAEQDAREAERLAGDHAEIAFHARRALAIAIAAQDKWAAAEPMLRQAAAFFRDRKESAEAARALLELARVQRRRPGASAVVIESLRSALEQADFSRRDVLVGEIERELAEVNQEELFRRAYRRARGAGIPEDIGSLSATQGEKATILFLDLRNFTGFSLTQDPRIVQMTLNQIFADIAVVVARHGIIINQYLGDGFMALVRDKDHARRAVAGALEMHSVIAAFNRPRRLLGPEPLLEARIGVATGDVVFGNIGTYRKFDFTAVGPTTNLAARLQAEARPCMVCISEETYRRVHEDFAFEDVAGRQVTLKGIGEARVWDVTRDGNAPG